MDHFLQNHHHHRRSPRYAILPPPHQSPNHHHHHLHERFPNHVLMVPDFHPRHPPPSPRVYTLLPSHPPHNPNYDSVPASTFHRPRDSDIESNFEGYDARHEIVEKTDNRFVRHWKKHPRVSPHFELGNRDIGDDAVNDVDNSRGKKEHTPNQQVQRKSAFLRIRKPNQWIREIEQPDSDKDKDGNLGNEMKAEKREGSPVELDISFELNSMVAKAVVSPSSSVVVSNTDMTTVSGTNLTPTRMSKKALSVISDSQVAKLSAVAVSSNSLPCKASDTSGAGKDVILLKNVSVACSQPCLGAADNLQGKNEMAQSSKGIVSDESNSLVTMADVPPSDSVSSDSQLAKLSAGSVSSNSLPCKAGDNSSSGRDVLLQKNVSDNCSQPCLRADHNPHEKNEVAKSSKGIVSDESNSLVAKDVVSPSSSVFISNTDMTLVSDTNLMYKRKRKRMKKKALISNSVCSDSQLAILSTGAVSSNCSLCKASGTSGSGKDVNSQKNVSDTWSQPCLVAAYNPHPHGKNEVAKSSEASVSDESNSLVAKAGVPPTSSVIVSDTRLMSKRPKKQRKKMRKEALVANSACSDSQLAILSTGAVSSNSSLCKAIDNPSSGKDAILAKNVSATCSQPCLGAAHDPRGKNEGAKSSKGIVSGGSNSMVAKAVVPPTSSVIVSDTRLMSKRQRKKMRKEALLANSACFDSQLAILSIGAVSSNSSLCKAIDNPSSGKDMILAKNVSATCSQPCLGAAHDPRAKNEVAKSSKGIVSGDSNSMVAKAGVPPTSSVIVSDTSLMSKRQRKKMRKEALLANSACSDSQLAILSTGAVSSNSSVCKAIDNPSSGKDAILAKNVSATCSQPCLGAAHDPRGKNEVAKSSKGIVSGGSNSMVAKAVVPPTSSVIVSDTSLMSKRQRKKMRKEALLANSACSSQLAILSTGAVSSNSSVCKAIDNPSSGKDAILAKNVSATCSQPCLGAAHNPHGKNEVAKSSKGIVYGDSNSMVAKAVVSPSSSVIVFNTDTDITLISDTKLIPKRKRKNKRKKALLSDRVCSDSQLFKLSTGAVSSNSSLCKAVDTPSSGKDVIVAKNVSDTCSQPCLGTAQNPRANNEVAKSSKGIVLDGSNSLEAKAVVPPLSSVIFNTDTSVVSDTNLAPTRNRKKKALISDSVCSDSQLANLSTDAVISNSLPCKASDTSSSGKDVVLPKNVSDTCSQHPHGKDEVAHSSEGIVSDEIANVGSGKTSLRVVKKKRIVKRVVRRVVVKPKSNVLSSVSANMLDGTMKADGVTLSSSTASTSGKTKTSLNKNSATFEKVSISNCLRSLPSEGNHSFRKDKKRDIPLQSLGTHPRSRECNSDGYSDLGIERSKSSSCAYSNIEDKKSVSDCLDGNISAHGLLSMPNIDMVTKSLNGSTSSEINHLGDVNKKSCQGEVSLTPVKYLNVPDEMNSFSDGVACLSSNDLTAKSEENFTVCDIGNDSIAGKLYCENEAPTLSQDVILKENPDIAITVPSSGMVDFSSSSKTSIKDGPDFLHVNVLAKWDFNNESTNSEYGISFPHCGIMNDIGKQVPPSNVIVSPENCDTQIFPFPNISAVYGGDTNKIKKRRVSTYKNLSHSKMERMSLDLEKPVSIANVVDTTLSPLLMDHSPSEVLDQQSVQRLYFSSQSSTDGVTTLHGKRRLLEGGSYLGNNGNDGANKVSPLSKRKKATAGHPNLTQCPSELSGEIVATKSYGFQKSFTSESRVDVTDQLNLLKTGVTNTPLKEQRTPLPIDINSKENRSSPLIENLSIGCFSNATDPRKIIETNGAPNSSEDVRKYSETPDSQTGLSNNGEGRVEANDGNMTSLNAKRIIYIKPKSNQLVATLKSCDLSVSTDDKAQTACLDGYYRRSKNQLIRTSLVSHNCQTVAMLNSNVDSDGLGNYPVLCSRRFTKKRSHKVSGSLCKPIRASSVWTLCGKNSSKNIIDSVHYQKVLPQLFPWKRGRFLRNFVRNPASSSNSISLTPISNKLLLLRKRNAVYTWSTNGFSLWKSKVLGVGGSSLKWSKSIARHTRSKTLPSPSKPSGLAAKEAYIPRRLVIGENKYVRIGNVNQLIRDPKKRNQMLANEKVRWSLHTARQKLARKQKYCHFFTRFGKCNQDEGKCPYIHDPSKVAVCTKFLNGSCSNPYCKLTHKVIPDRMPDCSYFLQGLCANRNCPYRHVNVNPKASICEGFLKGYCADGNECRKKHSYVCPTYEATENCNQGTKCKLHHPKKQGIGKKRKNTGDHNSNGERYFGSIPIDFSEPGIMVGQRQRQQNNENEGEIADYISFEVDEGVAKSADQSYEEATSCDSKPFDLELDNLDELIKPVLIMNRNFMAQSSPVPVL